VLRVIAPLGGTDAGLSGLGTWVRAVLPRVAARLRAAGGSLVTLGTERDYEAYGDVLPPSPGSVRWSGLDRPGPSALWHLALAGRTAAARGAEVLLLPAANRRVSLRFGRVRTVSVVHDLEALRVDHKYDQLRTTWVRRVVTPTLARADVLVAVSARTAEDLRGYVGNDRDVRVVSNGVDAERFTERPGDTRERRARAALGLEGPYVLYPARIERPAKNHERLVEAFARSPLARTHTLVLAGADWGGAAAVDALSERLGARVLRAGRVDDDALEGLVLGADVVAMVGYAEGFGLPALEALAAGRPLLAANAGALPEVAGALARYCDPFDVDDMARALLEAARDEGYRARVREEGPRWASARGWDRTADGIVSACMAAAERAS
jgi:glycosyltransferase involved in cell wall biosynthesis